MSSMREIEWEACLLPLRAAPELERQFERETGRPGRMMGYFNESPWLADTMVKVSVQVMTSVHVEPDLLDLCGLIVSQDNSCRFCFGMQRAFLRMIGMSEKRIARMEQDLLTDEFTARERAAMDFARRISQSRPLASATDLNALKDHGFDRSEIVELAGVIGVHLFLNRMSTFVALPPRQMEQLPDIWYMRLLRPFVAAKFRRMRQHGKPQSLQEVERVGPMSLIVNALDGLPLARELRLIIDRLWVSSALSGRTVSILFAVVARALGSKQCEDEARRMLDEHGITKDHADQIITHLSCPILSPVEALLVPLARETVWYEPIQIQRRCAAVQHEISEAEFLDFCGATALLNALCRLGMLADAD